MNETDYHARREERIRYALAKQVPAMRFGVEIHTDYGTLSFYDSDAQRIATLAKTLLERQLKRLSAAKAKPVTRLR